MSDEAQQYSEIELDTMDAFATFKAALQGRDRAYFTPAVEPQNATQMVTWTLANGMSLADGVNVGFWQLAFANTKSHLRLDQDAPIIAKLNAIADSAFREKLRAMSSRQMKDSYKSDSNFRSRYDALSREKN